MRSLLIAARAWLVEDAAGRDVTTRGLFGPSARMRTVIVARARGILAGRGPVGAVFRAADSRCAVRWSIREGQAVRTGQAVATITGPVRAILASERIALNVLSRLSGIATLTARYVRAAAPVPVYATRKTAPGLRVVDKRAVEAGGGKAHRMDLSDGVLVKDNHLALLRQRGQSLTFNIRDDLAALRRLGHTVEIEAKTLAELRLALAAGADVVMLDGMPPRRLRRAVRIVRTQPGRRTQIEISGGVTLRNIRALARLRPDRISVGAITHSAPALDFSLDILSAGGHPGHGKSNVKR